MTGVRDQDERRWTIYVCSRDDSVRTTPQAADAHTLSGPMHQSVPVRVVPESEFVRERQARQAAEEATAAITEEMVEAGAKALYNYWRRNIDKPWEDYAANRRWLEDKGRYADMPQHAQARAVLRAALSAPSAAVLDVVSPEGAREEAN